MAKRKKKDSGIWIIITILLLIVVLGVVYYILYINKDEIEEKPVEVTTTTQSVMGEGSSYITLTDGDFAGFTINKVYQDVLEGKKNVLLNDKEYSFIDYIHIEDVNEVGKSLELHAYANVDMDQDGVEELVLLLSNSFGASKYAMLHYEDDVIYAYTYIEFRALESLKTDGTFVAASGATNYAYGKYKLEKGTNKFVEEAKVATSEYDISYTVDGKTTVYEDAFKEYEENFNKKTDASFIEIEL